MIAAVPDGGLPPVQSSRQGRVPLLMKVEQRCHLHNAVAAETQREVLIKQNADKTAFGYNETQSLVDLFRGIDEICQFRTGKKSGKVLQHDCGIEVVQHTIRHVPGMCRINRMIENEVHPVRE